MNALAKRSDPKRLANKQARAFKAHSDHSKNIQIVGQSCRDQSLLLSAQGQLLLKAARHPAPTQNSLRVIKPAEDHPEKSNE